MAGSTSDAQSLDSDSTASITTVVLADPVEEEVESSDEEIHNHNNNIPLTSTTKDAARTDIFHQWIKGEINQLSKEKGVAQSGLDLESLETMLSKQDNVKITDPREYQIELFERAKRENTIAVLPTGSGKTLIAVLLLRYILGRELEKRAKGQQKARYAFFLVNGTALVFQQHSVLDSNLEFRVEKVCGSMGCHLWTKQEWAKILDGTMVIVCTAQVLYECLWHGFITMDQINMLIFDEAHNAKQDHPYAKIFKEYYHTIKPPAKRPRIFGLTASPVDSKVDSLANATRGLEQLMNCKIITIAISKEYGNQASDMILYYSKNESVATTELFDLLKAKCGTLPLFQRLFDSARTVHKELGSWASDYFWAVTLAEERAAKVEKRAERDAERRLDLVLQIDADIDMIQQTMSQVANHNMPSAPQLCCPTLSPKVLELYDRLMQYFAYPNEARCIVFVETRAGARLLSAIFSRIGGKHLRAAYLVGAGSSRQTIEAEIQSFRAQVKTLMNFKKGEVNCLFATSVAEEGLDIPACNLVVRFNLYRSMIGYVQSKGRARHKNSKYFHMVERGNMQHREQVAQAQAGALQMQEWCKHLPDDRLLKCLDSDLPAGFQDLTEADIDAVSHAKLSVHNALPILSNFIATIPREDNLVTNQAQYLVIKVGSQFMCEIIMPRGAPIERCNGPPQSRKALARRAAAYQMCKMLKAESMLDSHLNSTFQKLLPDMRNAQLALKNKSGSKYLVRRKPSLWKQGIGQVPSAVYLTAFIIKGQLDRSHQPLGILTRSLLPDFPTFPLFLADGTRPQVHAKISPSPISCDGKHEKLLYYATTFTIEILLDVFNKTFDKDVAQMPYWIVPIHFDHSVPHVDLACLENIATCEADRWTEHMPHKQMEDRFLVDRWDPRRIFTIKVDPSKAARDPLPEDVSLSQRKKHRKDILDFSISLWKKSRASVNSQQSWNYNQPVIQADEVQFRQNLLTKPDQQEIGRSSIIYICPQPFRFSKLSTDIATSALVFPAIIHRVENYLIASEAVDVIGVKVDPALALEAVTKDSDNSEEDHEAKLNFRPGMGNNYERLELMGDTFLKMATSISLYAQKPNDNELFFHVSRMCMLCNKNLFQVSKKLRLFEFIRTESFSRRTWYPPGLKLLQGKGFNDQNRDKDPHLVLGDKTIADVSEALIGASFVQYNQPGNWRPHHWDAPVKAVTALVCHEEHRAMSWKDYWEVYHEPAWIKEPTRATHRKLAEEVEKIHDYHFKNVQLLRCAFNHPSNTTTAERIPSYQRLEFLGDALLDVACVSYLFYKNPTANPQWLTEHKMAMVSNKFLSALCVELGFHKFMHHLQASLMHQITEYTVEVQTAVAQAAPGEVNYWTNLTRDIKSLSDMVESYVGAIFVDSGFDYAVVQRFFDMRIKPYFMDMSIYDSFANNHPVTRLHHILAVQLGCSDFKLMAHELPQEDPRVKTKLVAALMVHGKIAAHAVRESGGYAKSAASKLAIEMFEHLSRPEYRQQYGCGCAYEKTGDTIPLADVGTAV